MRGRGMLRMLRHEVGALLSTRVVWFAGLALLLLIGYAVHVGVRGVEGQRAQLEEAQAEEAERYASLRSQMEVIRNGETSVSPFQDPTRPYIAGRARGQRYAVLSPASFQATAVGQSDLIPPVVPVTLDGADARGGREEIENPLHLLTGPLDLAFLISFLLPLLAIALSFDLLSRERESGTLALLLSQPISVRTLVMAKGVARWAILFGLTVGAVAGGLLFMTGSLSPGRFVLWSGVVGLYLAFWVALAALVNATGRSSARNAVVLAFLWLFFVILIPAGVQITAGLLHPVPSRAELVAQQREETRQVEEQAAAVLAQYYDDHPELLPEGSVDAVDFQTRAFAVQEEVERRLRPLRERHRSRLEGQKTLVHGARWLSPTLLTHDALLTLAGTGDRRLAHFETQVRSYQDEWHDFFAPLIYADARLGPTELEEVPTWSFEDETDREVALGVIPSLLGLLLLSGLGAGVAAGRLRNGGDRTWAP